MADRNVRPADELEEFELPEVTAHFLNTHKTTTNTDVFAKPAEELKTLKGTTAAFKRRTTTEIKKFQRSADGEVGTKQKQERTFYSGYDQFDVIQPQYNMEYLAKLYELSAPHYAAVNAKVANIVGLGYKLVENTKSKRNLERMASDAARIKEVRRRLSQHRDDITDILENMNEEDTLTETLIKVWRDYEVTGNGYIEVGRKKDGTIALLAHIPSQTMRIRRARDGFVQIAGFDVEFFANFGAHKDANGEVQRVNNPISDDDPNEVIHIKKYSPTAGYYGVPDIVAATQAVAGNEFAARYNLDYFENKAVPRYAIILKGAKLGHQAEQQLLSFFETGLKGQNHRSVYIPLPSDTADNKVDLKMQAIEAGTQDYSFAEYTKHNLAEILMAHRVPVTKVSVSEGASLAVAKDADRTFAEQVCEPEQRTMEKKLNRVVKELTDKLTLSLNEMTLTDENTQSQIDERRRTTGVETANEQRLRRGDTAIEGGDELFDMNAALKIAQMTNKTTQRGQDISAKATQQAAQTHAAAVAAGVAAGANPAAPTPPGGRPSTTGNPTGTTARDRTRSASATDSAGAARNPKGEGRTTT